MGTQKFGAIHAARIEAAKKSGYGPTVGEVFWSDSVVVQSPEGDFLFAKLGRLFRASLSLATEAFETKNLTPPAYQAWRLIDPAAFAAFLLFFYLAPLGAGLAFY